MVCKYNPREDIYISQALVTKNAWEPEISQQFLRAAHDFGTVLNNVVFVDCGINIGVHSLFMAANGIRIFGVDPLEENLLHVS